MFESERGFPTFERLLEKRQGTVALAPAAANVTARLFMASSVS